MYKHGERADPLKHYYRLGGPALEEAEKYVESLVENYCLVHRVDGDEARADDGRMDFQWLAAMYHQWMQATAKIFEEDFVVKREREYETDEDEIGKADDGNSSGRESDNEVSVDEDDANGGRRRNGRGGAVWPIMVCGPSKRKRPHERVLTAEGRCHLAIRGANMSFQVYGRATVPEKDGLSPI